MSNRKKLRNLLKKDKQRFEKIANAGPIREVKAPDDDKVVLKEVPAKVWRNRFTPEEEFEVVGSAIIYDDASVDVIYFEDRSGFKPWARELLEEMLDSRNALTHYSLPDILKERNGTAEPS